MKGPMDVATFLHRVEHILVYKGIINGSFHPEAFGDSISGDYNRYKTNARTRNIEFHLSKEWFDETTKQLCYICGKPNTRTHQNGIDRTINMIGYTPENCQSCCSECNYMKNRFSYEEIISKCREIHTHSPVLNYTTHITKNKRFSFPKRVVRIV